LTDFDTLLMLLARDAAIERAQQKGLSNEIIDLLRPGNVQKEVSVASTAYNEYANDENRWRYSLEVEIGLARYFMVEEQVEKFEDEYRAEVEEIFRESSQVEVWQFIQDMAAKVLQWDSSSNGFMLGHCTTKIDPRWKGKKNLSAREVQALHSELEQAIDAELDIHITRYTDLLTAQSKVEIAAKNAQKSAAPHQPTIEEHEATERKKLLNIDQGKLQEQAAQFLGMLDPEMQKRMGGLLSRDAGITPPNLTKSHNQRTSGRGE